MANQNYNDQDLSGKVSNIFQNGWMLGGKVLRAAKVAVYE
jgi:molecular chaperone GrpE (heat shock protein)